MSEWGVALIAAGSAVAGSAVTGWFTRSAGRRQAEAARHAGERQADALLHTVQATLDEQRRVRIEDRRRRIYVDLLHATQCIVIDRVPHQSADVARHLTVVTLEGPPEVALAGTRMLAAAQRYIRVPQPDRDEARDAYFSARDTFMDAVRELLNDPPTPSALE
ncbi:hypothetical protein [Streptomyces wuyuanensis]|uniref:hypothetical protein n=1 Tax=Streptomyces wuyuanensis TaxID=1196353 RepID=UPI00342080B6